MSTRGLIAVLNPDDGSCRSIYVHNDMYPEHAAVTLKRFYDSEEKAEGLLALGDLSSLGPTPEACVAYARDRGEELHAPMQWSDRWQLAREAFDRFWANYVYLFMDGKWFMTDNGPWEEVVTE